MQAVTAAWVLQGRGVGLGATREAHEFGGAGLPYRVREAQVSVEGCPPRGLALVGVVLVVLGSKRLPREKRLFACSRNVCKGSQDP